MKEWKNRTTLPINPYTGSILKVQMLKGNDQIHGPGASMTTINMGAHLMTNVDTEEVTICQFNGKTITYDMGHTYSSPATIQEIADWTAEMADYQARKNAEYDREMLEEEFLQRSGNIY